MMLNNPRISVKEMSLVLSLAERTIKRDVAAMQKMGLLVHEGNTSAGHWVVIKPKSVIRISLFRTAKRNPLIFPI